MDLAVASLRADPMCNALAEMGISAAPHFEGIVFGGLVVDRITLLGSEDDLGLKSIARFKDLDNRDFSERYLIGTLTSVLVAIASGLAVRGFLGMVGGGG